ncbi:MAG: hypothetical protein ACRDTF_09130 [Pseudonocardiaceae bacterium]
MGNENDSNDSHDDDSKDDGGQHREEDNTFDGSHDRPIPPPPELNKHDR